MRKGFNPLKNLPAPYQIPPVVLTVITHLPNYEGYHRERAEIIQRCINSMLIPNVPLLIWDNGSDREFVETLKVLFQPTFLIQSPNIGKQAARAMICHMFPPDTVLSFSDDDMLFAPGWLDASLELLNIYPNVGVVSCWPVRFSFGWGKQAMETWAKREGMWETGRFIPETWERDYAKSIGVSPDRWVEQTKNALDYRVSYRGVQAYATAQHCQFICRAGVIAPFTEYKSDAMGEERSFDEAIDNAGLLRLTTIERYARHLGNVAERVLA